MFPTLGRGLGLRREHYRHVIETKPNVGWFEVISENFMVAGGNPRRVLEAVRRIRVLGEISEVELIASGCEIRELLRLKRVYGVGRWRKLKRIARVVLPDGSTARAEVHMGRRELKIKRRLREPS